MLQFGIYIKHNVKSKRKIIIEKKGSPVNPLDEPYFALLLPIHDWFV